MSRATVNQVETGSVKEGVLTCAERLLAELGLSLQLSLSRGRREKLLPKSSPLELRSRTAGVSYRTRLNPRRLHSALVLAELSPEFTFPFPSTQWLTAIADALAKQRAAAGTEYR